MIKMTGYQFILVQCFSILFADFVASPGVEDYSGSMERSSFSSGRGPFRQNDSIKTSEVSSEIFPFEQILEDFNDTLSCASKRDF